MKESTQKGLLHFVPERYRSRMVYIGMCEGEHRFLLMAPYKIQGRPVGPIGAVSYRPAVAGSQWIGLSWETSPCSGELAWVVKRMDALYEGRPYPSSEATRQ